MKKLLTVLACLMLAVTAFGQWEMVKGPEAYGFLPEDAIALSEDVLLAVVDNVVMKTVDFGTNWTEIIVDPADISINEIDSDGDVVYVCANGGLVYKSSDAGETWASVKDTALNFNLDLNKIDVLDSNNVFIAADDGCVMYTANGGATWDTTYVGTGDDLNGGVAFSTTLNGIAFSNGTGDAIYTTHDGGATWTATAGSWPVGLSTRHYDAVALEPNVFMVGCYNNVIWKSVDGGDTWTLVSEYTYVVERITYVKALDANTVVAMNSNSDIFTTTDAGATWDTLNVGSSQSGAALAFSSATRGWVWTSNNQVYKTVDGETFEPVNTWPAVPFYAIGFAGEGELFATANYGGEITMSTDGGETWTYPTNAATGAKSSLYDIKFIDDDMGLAAGSDGTMLKTVDGGVTWTKIENPMSAIAYKSIYFIYLAPGGDIYAGGSSGMLMKSTDNGDSWELVEVNSTMTIYGMTVFSNGLGFLGGNSGKWCMSSSTSLDTFDQIIDMGSMNIRQAKERNGVILIPANDDIYRMNEDYDSLYSVFDIPDGDDAYALEWVSDDVAFFVGSHGIIYRTDDAGETWIKEFSRADDYLYDLQLDGGKLWAVGKFGVIMSRDDITTPQPYLTEEFTDGTADLTWVENDEAANDGGLNLTVVADSAGMSNVGIWTDDANTGLIYADTDKKLKNYEVSADIYIVKEASATQPLYKGLAIKMDPEDMLYYRLVYRNSSTSSGAIKLQGFDGANWYISKQWNAGEDFDTLETGFHNFKAQVIDNEFWCYVDDELLPGCPYTHDGAPVVDAGYPGMYVYTGTVEFDNFMVKVLDYPKYSVTANVDMGIMVRRGEFDPASSNLDIMGSFDNWTDGVDMTDVDGDTIYTAQIGEHEAGTTIYFKCRRNGAWDNTEEYPYDSGNREYLVLDEPDQVIPTFLYNNITEVAIDGVPATFALEQNYPNPFNPATTVKFQIPDMEMVNISVYDIAGRKVAEVMNTQLEAGYYSVNFNASILPSGVYLYRITAGEFSDVKKMTLLK